jgi:hypothetical protein
MATLRLSADALDPTLVTNILATQPELSARQGEGLVARADKARVPARVGTWYITTRQHVSEQNPADHLSWILRLVAPKIGDLRAAVPALNASFSLLVHDEKFQANTLPSNLLREVVSIGDLEIEVPERAMDIVVDARNVGRYLAP